jgi:hypothetical protein
MPFDTALALLKWDLQWIFEGDDLTAFYPSFLGGILLPTGLVDF